jgi:archaellum biogenesis ATPase FlaH
MQGKDSVAVVTVAQRLEEKMEIEGFQVFSDIPEEPVEWLWEGYIPLGEITIVEGHPGTNKSSLTIDLAARVSRGRHMPCVTTGEPANPAGVLFLVGEDSIAKTVRSRLDAAGADLTRIGVFDDLVIPKEADMLRIEKAVRRLNAKLIVVDTLNDFVRGNVLCNQQVRRALRPLRELAEKTKLAVLPSRHFIKSGGQSLLRGGGSVAITALARSQLKLLCHPDDPNLRVVIQDKCNLGPLSPSLMFELISVGNNTFRLDWRECQLTIEDLERKQKASPTLDAAERFLLDQLADGQPREANSLIEAAKGICSKRTLDEAKRSLGLKTIRVFEHLFVVPFSQVVDGMDAHHEIIPEDKLRPNEKVWRDLIHKVKYRLYLADEGADHSYMAGRHFAHNRKICIGISNCANGWTDATSLVAINREFLEKQTLNIVGFCNVGQVLLHEFCHRNPDLDNHDHDQDFYELFHDSGGQFMGAFVDGCFTNLPEIMTKHNKKLTQLMLYQQDMQVLGQRGTEQMQRTCNLPRRPR